MLYLIGLGLNEKGYSRESYDIISKADKIYIENYTVNFPYDIKKLEKQFEKKNFITVDRKIIENGINQILEEAKKKKVVLMVYGSPLIATTHFSIIHEVINQKIKYKIIHNASIIDAVSETGLQLYKFGKTASIPEFEAESFMEIVKDNLKINAHSLILIDIGLDSNKAIDKLEKAAKSKKVKLKKIIICSQLGTENSKIFYGIIHELKSKKINKPYCIIIPGKLHFAEEEFLENFI